MPSEDYYKSAGGLFKDMTIHDFDLARFYLDEDPVEIFAAGQRLIDPNMMNKINDYDTAMFILTYWMESNALLIILELLFMVMIKSRVTWFK